METRFYPDYSNLDWLALTLTAMAIQYITYRYSQMPHHTTAVTAQENKLTYSDWESIVGDTPLPAAFVDMNAVDSNLNKLLNIVNESNKSNESKKTIRLATKSIRVPEVIKYALKKGGPLMQGVMCYSAREAQLLWEQKICKDFLIAYPTVQTSHLEILLEMHRQGADVALVLDSIEQMERVVEVMNDAENPFPIVLELDTSIRFLSGFIHLGARRSSIHTADDLRTILKESKEKFKTIEVIGIMAYESAVAGLPDNNPYKSSTMNSIASLVRRLSAAHTAKLRALVPQIFKEAGLRLRIFNGGGTASIDITAAEASGLTELTVGSFLFNSHLFDCFSNLDKYHLEPAIHFVMPITRISDNGKYATCYSDGSFIASGAVGEDKLPKIVWPQGLKLTSGEGVGEVQTPVEVTNGMKLKPGQFIVCRPTKAGELAKTFDNYTCFFRSPSQLNLQEKILNRFTVKAVDTYKKFGI